MPKAAKRGTDTRTKPEEREGIMNNVKIANKATIAGAEMYEFNGMAVTKAVYEMLTAMQRQRDEAEQLKVALEHKANRLEQELTSKRNRGSNEPQPYANTYAVLDKALDEETDENGKTKRSGRLVHDAFQKVIMLLLGKKTVYKWYDIIPTGDLEAAFMKDLGYMIDPDSPVRKQPETDNDDQTGDE